MVPIFGTGVRDELPDALAREAGDAEDRPEAGSLSVRVADCGVEFSTSLGEARLEPLDRIWSE